MNLKFPLTKTLSLILLMSALLTTWSLHATTTADSGPSPEGVEAVPDAIVFDVEVSSNSQTLDFIMRLNKDNIIIVDWGDPNINNTVVNGLGNGSNISFNTTFSNCSGTCTYTVTIKTCASDISYFRMVDQKATTFVMASTLSSLKYLELTSNDIGGNFDLTSCASLEEIRLSGTDFTNIDITNLTNLKTIYAGNCKSLTTFDFSVCKSLEYINIGGSRLTTLVLDNPNLTFIHAGSNDLQGFLDFTKCPVIEYINVGINGHNTPMSLDFSNLTKLKNIDLYSTITVGDIDLRSCTALEKFKQYYYCANGCGVPSNATTNIFLDGLANLTYVTISGAIPLSNPMDLGNSSNLVSLRLDGTVNIPSLTVASELPQLVYLDVENNSISALELDALIEAIPKDPVMPPNPNNHPNLGFDIYHLVVYGNNALTLFTANIANNLGTGSITKQGKLTYLDTNDPNEPEDWTIVQ